MKTSIVTSAQFQDRHNHVRPSRCHHTYKAHAEGNKIIVVDEQGSPVTVKFAGTTNRRTMYARVEGVGYIGGWQYPHKSRPWLALVDSINKGLVYCSQDDLPKRSAPLSHCPHCGEEL